jgi:hypothetical protein
MIDINPTEDSLLEAQRLLSLEFAEAPFQGYFALRAQFGQGQWLLVTKPNRDVEPFSMLASERPAEFAWRVLEKVRPQKTNDAGGNGTWTTRIRAKLGKRLSTKG